MDEILVKGKDGKWYVLKGGELLPYGTAEGVEQRAKSTKAQAISSPKPLALSPKQTDHEGHPLRVELDELVTQVLQDSKLDFVDPVLQKRFRTIVSARLRDVRDSAETKAMLLRDQKIGGMGMVDESGIRNQESGVMEIIEKAFQDFQAKWKEIEERRIEGWKAKQKQEQENRAEQKIKEEEEELKKRYDRLTGGISKLQITNSKQAPKPKIQIPKLDEKTMSQPAGFLKRQLTVPSLSKPLPSPPPPPPRLPPPPIRPPSSVLRPPSKITDVRPAPRLIGPIEELSSITLKDFRRIAATPQAGIDKIISKIDFLSKESLTRRTEGIKAWQSSPLFKTYSKISATALTSRCSPQSVLERFTTEGQSVLTLEEFYAIMELNQKLRF